MCVCAVVPLAARIHARDSRRRCPDGRFEEEGRALTADKSTEHFFFLFESSADARRFVRRLRGRSGPSVSRGNGEDEKPGERVLERKLRRLKVVPRYSAQSLIRSGHDRLSSAIRFLSKLDSIP